MASGRDIRAGRAYVELGVDDKLAAGLRAAQQTLKRFGAEVTAAGLKMTALGGAAAGGLFLAAKSFADVGDSLDEMSARTGITVERLSQMQYAAKLAGVGSEALETTLRKMQKTIIGAASGSKEAVDALSELGLSAAQLRGMSPDEQYRAIGDAISRISEPAQRAAAAMAIFGKSGTAILPLFQDGAAGFDAMNKQAEEFALTLSTQDSKAAARFADSLDLVTATTTRLAGAIGSALAPLLTDVATSFSRLVAAGIRWANANRQIIVYAGLAAAGVTALGAAVTGLGISLSVAGVVAGGLATAVTAIGAAFAAAVSPIGLVTIALGGGVSALLYYSGAGGQAIASLSQVFGALWANVSSVLSAILSALSTGDLASAGRVGIAALNVVYLSGLMSIRQAFYDTFGSVIQFANDFYSALQAGWEATYSAMTTATIEAVAFIGDAWAVLSTGALQAWEIFTSGVTGVWDGVQNYLIDAWLGLFNLFGQLTDEQLADAKKLQEMDFGKQTSDRTSKSSAKIAALGDARNQTLADNDSKRSSARAAEDERHAKRMLDIAQEWSDSSRAIDDAAGKSEAAAKELEAAKEELAAAMAKANGASGNGIVPGTRSAPSVDDLQSVASDAIARTQSSGSFAGALSRQIAGFSASSTPAQLKDIGNKLDTLTRQAAGISQQIGGIVA